MMVVRAVADDFEPPLTVINGAATASHRTGSPLGARARLMARGPTRHKRNGAASSRALTIWFVPITLAAATGPLAVEASGVAPPAWIYDLC
jgi:hypothetical protein